MLKDTQIRQLTWTKSWAAELYEFSAMLVHEGVELYGHGSAFDKNLALNKAVAEVYERKVQKENNITRSNGMAAHINYDKAFESAKKEAFERHVYLKGHDELLPIKKISLDNVPHKIKTFYENMLQASFDIEIYDLGRIEDYQIIQVMSYDKNMQFGHSMGLGSEQSLDDAIIKASIESFRRAVWARESEHTSEMDLKKFQEIKNHTHTDHRELAFNLEYSKLYRAQLHSRLAQEACTYTFNGEFEQRKLYCSIKTPFKFLKLSASDLVDVKLGFWGKNELPHSLA